MPDAEEAVRAAGAAWRRQVRARRSRLFWTPRTGDRDGPGPAFGLSGVHNLPVWEALEQRGICVLGVRHEQIAAYAARATPAPGTVRVALVTTRRAANTVCATGEAFTVGSRSS